MEYDSAKYLVLQTVDLEWKSFERKNNCQNVGNLKHQP